MQFFVHHYTSIKLNKYYNLARSGREKLPINTFKGESQKMYKLVLFQALISPGASISTSALSNQCLVIPGSAKENLSDTVTEAS